MPDPLQGVLGRSCVSIEGRGTGFFVGPSSVLTCAHVVSRKGSEKTVGDEVLVTMLGGETRLAPIAELHSEDDIAVLTLARGDQDAVVLAGADGELTEDEKLLVVGYPVFDKTLRELASLSVVYDGGSDAPGQRRLQFKGNHVVGGFSGSPLLNLHTGHVVGMVTETRGKTGPLGGWAIPAETILGKLAGLNGGTAKDAAPAWYEALDERQNFIDPSSPGYQPVFQQFAQDGSRPLEFGTRAVGFIGRDAEMARLRQFLDHAASFAWFLTTGSAGVGKSRLALEFCLACQPSWQAGFIEKNQIDDLPFWRRWRPNRPTLLVVDYAGPYGDALGELARTLAGKRHRPRVPIRLLLIERERGDWYDRFAGKGSSDRAATLSSRFPSRDGPDLTVGPLSDTELVGILASVAPSRFAVTEPAAALAGLASFDPDKRALFAILFAETTALAGDRDAAMREILRRERQARWEPAGCTEEDMALLALATILGGATRENLQAHAPWIDKAVAQWNLARFHVLTGQAEKSKLDYLKPNLIGELFVLDWLDDLSDDKVRTIVEAMWSVSVEGSYGFLMRAVPDFPHHPALRRLAGAPAASPRAIHVWASAVVDITRHMPPRYLALGEWLHGEIASTAARLPQDAEVFELLARSTLNLAFLYGRASMHEEARECRSQFEAMLDKHLDRTRALRLLVRALMSDIILLVVQDEQDLAGPLRPAPITFALSRLRMSEAQKAFDRILSKLPRPGLDDELSDSFANAAYHLVLGYGRPGIVIPRVWFPASAMLAGDVAEQLGKAEQAYRTFKAVAGRMPIHREARPLLARAASALAVAYANVKREKDIGKLRGDVTALAKSSPDDPRIREELARIDYALVFALHRAGRLKAARDALAALIALTEAHPGETAITSRREKATALLEQTR